MKKLTALLLALLPVLAFAQTPYDIYQTSIGDVEITWIGHGSVAIVFNNKVIHIDPYSKAGDYAEARAADLILITHEHADHFDKKNSATPHPIRY